MTRLAAALFALPLLAISLAAEAQPAGRIIRIGLLTVQSPNAQNQPLYDALREGLRARGWVEGQNVTIERRASEGQPERFPALATELVALRVDLIVTVSNAATRAARRATDTIPIVMAVSGAPERAGLVATLARPGGNVTGLSADAGPEIGGKLFELLREIVPTALRVTLIVGASGGGMHSWTNSNGTAAAPELEAATAALGMNVQSVVLKTPNDFLAASDAIVRGRSQALVVDNSAPTYVQGPAILDFATKHRLPVVGAHREIAEVGGLLSYGASLGDLFRRTGLFVDRILRGAKPADLPVEQPTKFELVINLKTAKALGLTIPQSVLARADEIIQ